MIPLDPRHTVSRSASRYLGPCSACSASARPMTCARPARSLGEACQGPPAGMAQGWPGRVLRRSCRHLPTHQLPPCCRHHSRNLAIANGSEAVHPASATHEPLGPIPGFSWPPTTSGNVTRRFGFEILRSARLATFLGAAHPAVRRRPCSAAVVFRCRLPSPDGSQRSPRPASCVARGVGHIRTAASNPSQPSFHWVVAAPDALRMLHRAAAIRNVGRRPAHPVPQSRPGSPALLLPAPPLFRTPRVSRPRPLVFARIQSRSRLCGRRRDALPAQPIAHHGRAQRSPRTTASPLPTSAGGVFHEHEPGSYLTDNPRHLAPESAALAVDARPLPATLMSWRGSPRHHLRRPPGTTIKLTNVGRWEGGQHSVTLSCT